MQQLNPEQQRIVQSFMEANDVPGASVALVVDGEMQAAQGFGIADIAAARPVTPDTLFAVASLTKSVTSVTALQQVEAGRLNLDTPVKHYLPDLLVHDAEFTAGLTMRRLLSHQGGLGRTGHQDRTREEEVNPFPTRAALVAGLRDAVPQCAPGQAFSYSNEGYAIAGHVIETVAGKPLERCFLEDVYAPAGMQRSRISFADWRAEPDHAVPYGVGAALGPFDTGERHGHLTVARLIQDYQAFLSTGGVVSSAIDFARYQCATLDTTGRRIGLSAGGLDQLGAVQFPYGDTGWGYGLGYWVLWSGTSKLIGHSGGLPGASTYSLMLPAEGAGVVVLTNRSDIKAMVLAEQLMSTLVGKLWRDDPGQPLPFDSPAGARLAGELGQFAGNYRFRKGAASVEVLSGGMLLLRTPSRYDGPEQRITLKPVGPDQFLGTSLGQAVPFFRDPASGAVSGFGLTGYRYQREDG